MATLIFEHHPSEKPARLGAVLRDYGHSLRVVRLHAGDPVPADLDDVDAIVCMGGPMNVDQQDEHPWMAGEMDLIRQAQEHKEPQVGVCLGAQLIATALGGEVQAMQTPEIGWHTVRLAFPGTIDPMMAGIPWTTMQFHAHGQQVTTMPDSATPLAASKLTRNQAFKVGLHTYCFQYHFEWDRSDLDQVMGQLASWYDDTAAVESARQEMDQHYPLYRHLGDRLCHNLANLLLPLDKRLGGRRGAVEPTPVKNWRPAES